EAVRWLHRAADAGDLAAIGRLGFVLGKQGDRTAARTWLEQAAKAGDIAAMGCLGALLDEDGDVVGARHWFTRAVERDAPGDIMVRFAMFLLEQSEVDEAQRWIQRVADHGDITALVVGAWLLAGEGRVAV